MSTRLAVIILLFSSIGWGLTWLPIKALGDLGLHGLHLVLIVSASVSLALLPWLIRQRTLWMPVLPFMLLVALFGGLANVTFQVSILYGDVIRVMILFYMLPVWSVIGGRLLLGEVIDKRRIITVLFCIIGAALILDVWAVSWTAFTWVDGLALLSGLALAANAIVFRFTANAPFTSKVGFMFLGGLVLVGGILLWYPVAGELPDNQTIFWAIAYSLGWIMFVSFGSMWGVTCLGAGRGSVLIVVELVVAVVSVLIITGVSLSLYEWLGCVMVLSAAVLEGIRK
jgi:drug/metabolite transporter (DMT)-like permease